MWERSERRCGRKNGEAGRSESGEGKGVESFQ